MSINQDSCQLIVPTHRRHDFVERLITFYDNTNIRVIFCDSSEAPYQGTLPANIIYNHYPGSDFSTKMLGALQQVEGKHVALCADDDFALPKGLESSCSFIKENEAFKTVLGKTIAYTLPFNGTYYDKYPHLKLRTINNDDPRQNLDDFLQRSFLLFWAMHDKEKLIKFMGMIRSSNIQRLQVIAVIFNFVCCLEGGIKYLDQLWGVREIQPPQQRYGYSSKGISGLNSNEADQALEEEYLKMKDIFDPEYFEGFSRLIIEHMKQNRTQSLEKSLRKGRANLKKNIINILPRGFYQYYLESISRKNEEYAYIDNDEDVKKVTRILKAEGEKEEAGD